MTPPGAPQVPSAGSHFSRSLAVGAVIFRLVWVHVQVRVAGALRCRGPRTVTAVLRVMGLGAEPRFARYHRVLSRARWSGLAAAKILLGLLLAV